MDSKLKQTDLIVDLLTKHPTMRDDDKRLIVNVWAADMKKQGIDPKQYVEFFELFKSDKLTHYDSITRNRRKLQEKHIDLRGEKYKERKKEESAWIDSVRNHEG